MKLDYRRSIQIFLRVIALIGLLSLQFRWPPELIIPAPYDRYAALIIGFLVFILGAGLIVLLLSFLYRKRKKLPAHKKDNVIIGLENVYYLLLTFALFLTILGFWDIDLRTLFTTLSIVAAAIAIISKDYISEIISGIIISFSREIGIDDYVKIGEHKGRIIDINFTKIALLNEDDDVIFLPNNKVFTSEILNYTRREIKKVSIEFSVTIASLKTIEELENDLIESVSEYQDHIVPQTYNLKIVDIQKDSLDLKFQYVLREINRELEREIRRKTVRRVVNYVKASLNSKQA